jgi:Protein of unknown function (DUF3710)
VFRWRRRSGQQDAGPEPDDQDYPATEDYPIAEDDLAEEDAGGEPAAGEWADGRWADADEVAAEPGFSAVGGSAGWTDEDELADEELADDELAYDEAVADDDLADDDLADDDLADDDLAGPDEELTGSRTGRGGAHRRRPERADLGDPTTWTRLRDTQDVSPAMSRADGPWDAASGYPEAERFDFGSLLVPVREGFDVQVFVSEEQGVSIAVIHGDSGLQLQPFAAPRSSGLWHEVLPEIADEVARAGGQSRQQEGPFGPELVARVVPQGAEGARIPPQPLRFIGADGPRWFLRGLISGPAAMDEQIARPLEEIFADVVVVRGDHAEPPRKPLDIRLPDEARQVLETQMAAQDQGQNLLENPFERGPEITETR